MVKRDGFTLVELLVVVAIISILAAMLLPTLSKARESARMVVCQSNLKQAGMLMMQYCDDYGGYFPDINEQLAWRWDISDERPINASCWTEVLGGLYLGYKTKSNGWGAGRYGVFNCPSAPYAYSGRTPDYGIDYGISNKVSPRADYGSPKWRPLPIDRSRITRPVIMAADSTSATINFPCGTTWQDVTTRHMGNMMKANFLFTDNHTESDSSYYVLHTDTSKYPWNWE